MISRGKGMEEKSIKDMSPEKGLLNFNEFKKLHWNSGPTALQLIISTHLYVENGLDVALCKILPHDDDLVRLSFWNKIVVARSIGFSLKSTKLLEKLNSIRNKFAHNLDYQITWNDLKGIELNTSYTENDFDEDLTGTIRGILASFLGYIDATFDGYSVTKKIG